jgi:hypothetical protein
MHYWWFKQANMLAATSVCGLTLLVYEAFSD